MAVVFFTIAGNILWACVQPALPPFAVLLALALRRVRWPSALWTAGFAGLLPVVLTVCAVAVDLAPHSVKTEKQLVEFAQRRDGV
nr:hypothetical protein [uncultured Duganella sp.]